MKKEQENLLNKMREDFETKKNLLISMNYGPLAQSAAKASNIVNGRRRVDRL